MILCVHVLYKFILIAYGSFVGNRCHVFCVSIVVHLDVRISATDRVLRLERLAILVPELHPQV